MKLETRPQDCLSDFFLDQMLAEECTASAAEVARAHLADCEGCRGRFEALSKARDAFAAAPPLFVASVAVERRSREKKRTFWMAGGGALALAAGLLLFVRTKPTDDGGESTRFKGASHIGFYVKRGEAVALGAVGERVHPGDSLRFVYSSSEPRYLTVLSLDGSRHASVYYPEASAAERIDPAVDQPLRSSTVLDGTLGAENIYGLFCREAIAVEPVRAALESTGKLPTLDGCEVDTLVIQKQPLLTP
jgi:hypothetical protein